VRYFQTTIRTISRNRYKDDNNIIIAQFPQVKTIEHGAFVDCENLKTANFPLATTIEKNAFRHCERLETAHFPQATTIEKNAFRHCERLETAHFPQATTIGYRVFRNCKKLKTAYFPQATTIGFGAFFGCVRLETAYFPQATTIGFGAFFDCVRLETALFPLAITIGRRAFCKCETLETAYFPEVTTIGAAAFYVCENLETALFPQATTIGYRVFTNCKKLKTAYFPQVTIIIPYDCGDGAFHHCNNLKYIVLQEAISDDERIRIGLSNNTVVIAAKDFDPSLLQFDSPEFIAKLYSQGPHIAKALLSMMRAELTTSNTLIEILTESDSIKHKEIHDILGLMSPNQTDGNNQQAKADGASAADAASVVNQPGNAKLTLQALTIFSQYYHEKTDKPHRKKSSCTIFDDGKDLKEILLRLTGVTQGELDRLKHFREDSLSKTVLESLQHAPTPSRVSTLKA
jgi:hypothetical protein